MNKKIQKYILASLFTAIICGGTVMNGIAQEAGYFNHHYLQPVMINPGATGFQGDQQVLLGYKHSWSDFPGAPRTFTALYHGSFADKIGLGFQLISDRVGVNQLFHGQLNYAYRFSFENVMMSVGISTGLETNSIKGTNNDPLIDPTDELLNEAIDGYLLFDGSFGVYGEVDQKFFFGVSLPNLVKNRLTDIAGDVNIPSLESFSYAVLMGYRFDIKNYDFVVEPSLTIKNLRYSPFLIDANVKFSFLDEQLVGGLGYTLGDNSRAALLLGTRINDLRFLYSYDVSLGDFQKYNNGSHELTLVYRIPARPAVATE